MSNRLMARAYLASTPYHLVLSVAIQLRDGVPPGVMILADEANLLQRAPTVRTVLDGILDVRSIPTLDQLPLWRIPLDARSSGWRALAILRSFDEEAPVYVFNGLTPQAQYLRRALNGRGRFECVEDGLDAYIPYNFAAIPWWHRTLHRWAFGNDHPFAHDTTSSLPFSRYHMLIPELARVPPGSEVLGIPGTCVVEAVKMLEEAFPIDDDHQPVTDLFLLDHSDRIDDVIRCVDDIACRANGVRGRSGGVPAVKAHPRETDRRLLELLGQLDELVFPHWVPAEMFAPHLRPDATVYCGLTTFVVSSRFLIPDRQILLNRAVRPDHGQVLVRWDSSIEVEQPGPGESAGPESGDGARR